MILNRKARALHHKVTPVKFEKKVYNGWKKSPNKFLARDIIKEICGKSPYELLAIDMLQKGQDKRVKKFLRKRLGSLKTAKKKIDQLSS